MPFIKIRFTKDEPEEPIKIRTAADKPEEEIRVRTAPDEPEEIRLTHTEPEEELHRRKRRIEQREVRPKTSQNTTEPVSLTNVNQPSTPPGSFILQWDQELGFSGNPFKAGHMTPVSKFITGYEKERDRINLFVINDNKFGLIYGGPGVGRSTLIKWLDEELKKYPDKVMVVTLGPNAFLEQYALLRHAQGETLGWWDKKVSHLDQSTDYHKNINALQKNLSGRKLIILGDGVTHISKDNLLFLNMLLKMPGAQLIMTTDAAGKKHLDSIMGLTDHLNISLSGLNLADTGKMLQRRIEHFGGSGIAPFNDKLLKQVWEKAGKNPRKVLQFCERGAIELSVRQRRKTRGEANAPTIDL